jgi:hypothetical protein
MDIKYQVSGKQMYHKQLAQNMYWNKNRYMIIIDYIPHCVDGNLTHI